MQIHTGKVKETKLQSAANAISHNKGNSNPTFQFVDNRPRVTQLKEIQELTKNSPRIQKPIQLQKQPDTIGGKTIQMMRIGGKEFKILRDLKVEYKEGTPERKIINAIESKQDADFELMQEELKSSHSYENFENLMEYIASRTTTDKSQSMEYDGDKGDVEGPLNAKGGPISGLKKGGGEFPAGSGENWHVHYDHVKCGNDQNSRVDFQNKTSDEIIQEMNQKNRSDLKGDKLRDWNDVIAWVHKNK